MIRRAVLRMGTLTWRRGMKPGCLPIIGSPLACTLSPSFMAPSLLEGYCQTCPCTSGKIGCAYGACMTTRCIGRRSRDPLGCFLAVSRRTISMQHSLGRSRIDSHVNSSTISRDGASSCLNSRENAPVSARGLCHLGHPLL